MLRRFKVAKEEDLKSFNIVEGGKEVRRRTHALMLSIEKWPFKSQNLSLANIYLEQARMALGNSMREVSPHTDPYSATENTRKIRKIQKVAPPADLAIHPFLIPGLDISDDKAVQLLDKMRWEIDELLPVIEKIHMSISYQNAFTPIVMLFIERAYVDLAMGRNFIGRELASIGSKEERNERG